MKAWSLNTAVATVVSRQRFAEEERTPASGGRPERNPALAFRSIGSAALKALLAALLFAAWAARAATSAPSLTVPPTRGFPGQTVSVPLFASFPTNAPRNVVALQADIGFDPASLSSGTPLPAAALSNQVLASSQPASGVRRVLIYSLNNTLFTNGVVASLPFSISPTARGTMPLTLTNVVMASASGKSVVSTEFSGYITVEPVYPRPDGDVDVFLRSVVGKTYVIQATTNLVQWVNILTNTATSGILTFTDPNAHLYRYRFYRAVPIELAPSLSLAGSQGHTYIIQATTNLVNWVNISTNYQAGSAIAFTDPDASRYARRFYRALLFDAETGGWIGTLTLSPAGAVNFTFGAVAGRTYVIQATTNLEQWVNLSTTVATNGSLSILDTSATNFPYRFYRVRVAP